MSSLILNSANVTLDTTPIQIVTKTKINIEQLENGVQITGEDDSGVTSGTVLNGEDGATPEITITAQADNLSSETPTVTVTKSGTDEAPNFDLAFSGLKGGHGLSAYEVAVENGYEGTEQEWLNSLSGNTVIVTFNVSTWEEIAADLQANKHVIAQYVNLSTGEVFRCPFSAQTVDLSANPPIVTLQFSTTYLYGSDYYAVLLTLDANNNWNMQKILLSAEQQNF